MKKNIILMLYIISAVLLIGSFPLRLIAGSIVCDVCRLMGFVLLGFCRFQKDKKSDK